MHAMVCVSELFPDGWLQMWLPRTLSALCVLTLSRRMAPGVAATRSVCSVCPNSFPTDGPSYAATHAVCSVCPDSFPTDGPSYAATHAVLCVS